MIKLSREHSKTLRRLAQDYLLLLFEASVHCEVELHLSTELERIGKYADSLVRNALVNKFLKQHPEVKASIIEDSLLDFALRNEAFREMLEERRSDGISVQIHTEYGARKQAFLNKRSSLMGQGRYMFEIERFVREMLAYFPHLEEEIWQKRQCRQEQ